MRRFLAAGLAAIAVFGLFFGAQAAEKETVAPLAVWAGKYPYDEVEGRDLLETKLFAERLKRLIGEERFGIFEKEFWKGVSFPIQEKDGILAVQFCKVHACMDTRVLVYILPDKDRMDACWMNGIREDSFWLAEGKAEKSIGKAGCLEELTFDLYAKYREEK